MIGNCTFCLEEDTKIESFNDALIELDICDAMKSMYPENSDKSIFDLKVLKMMGSNYKSSATNHLSTNHDILQLPTT